MGRPFSSRPSPLPAQAPSANVTHSGQSFATLITHPKAFVLLLAVSAFRGAQGSFSSIEPSRRRSGTYMHHDLTTTGTSTGERSMRAQITNRINRECFLAIGLLA